jgi:hypothetical protein
MQMLDRPCLVHALLEEDIIESESKVAIQGTIEGLKRPEEIFYHFCLHFLHE